MEDGSDESTGPLVDVFDLGPVVDWLFDSIAKEGTFSPEHASKFVYIFGTGFQKSTRFVDKKAMTKIQELGGTRFYFRVDSNDKKISLPYICFKEYCSCVEFQRQAEASKGKIYCKHLLACRLADALDLCTVETLTRAKYAETLGQDMLNCATHSY